MNVHFADLGVVAWKNLGYMLYGMGALVFPLELESFLWQLVRITVAAGIIRGVSREWRNPVMQPYLAVTILTVAELLVWHFPPNLRLMYPLIPLLIAGLLREAEAFGRLIRTAWAHRERSQRMAAAAIGGVAAAAILTGIWMQGYMLLRTLPDMIRDNERLLVQRKADYDWLNQHVDPKAAILADNPALYLYTGRQTAPHTPLPIYWYREDSASAIAAFRDLPGYAASNRLAYLYIHDSEYGKSLGTKEAGEARRAVESNPGLRIVYRSSEATVFQRVTPAIPTPEPATAEVHFER